MPENVLALIIGAFLGAVFGGAGLVGTLMHYFKRYVDKKLTLEEEKSEQCIEYKTRKARIDQELQHAQGRLFYWLFRAIKDNHTNVEDLETAFIALKTAEGKKEELEQEIIIEYDQRQNNNRHRY